MLQNELAQRPKSRLPCYYFSQSTFSSSKPLTSILEARFLLSFLRRTRRPHKTKPNKSRHRHILPDLSASKSRRPFCGSFWVSVHSTPFSYIRSTPSKGLELLFRAFRGRNAINGTAKLRFSARGISGDGGFVGFTCEVEGFGIAGLFWSFLGGFPGAENRMSFFPPYRSRNKFLLCGLQIIHRCCDYCFRHRRQVDCSYWMLRILVGRSLSLSRIFFWASVSAIWSQFGLVLVLQIALFCRLLPWTWAHLIWKSTRRLK